VHFVIYGAGAIGGAIGARLFTAGFPVTLIARGQHSEIIQRQGLRYRDTTRDEMLAIDCVSHPKAVRWREDSVVIATMKGQDSESAFESLFAATGDRYPIFCAQNGVANEALAQRYFSKVFAMLVVLPATYLTAGEVIHSAGTPGGLLDTYGFNLNASPQTATDVAAALTQSGFASLANPDTMALKHAKLLQNLGNALDLVLEDRDHSRDIMRRLRHEALSVFDAAGRPCADAATSSARFNLVERGRVTGAPRGGSSTWQSKARGQSRIETPYLNGEICLLGRQYGIPTPSNNLVMAWAFKAISDQAWSMISSAKALELLLEASESH
jgi:2-dehydropantoate 2-reductase